MHHAYSHTGQDSGSSSKFLSLRIRKGELEVLLFDDGAVVALPEFSTSFNSLPGLVEKLIAIFESRTVDFALETDEQVMETSEVTELTQVSCPVSEDAVEAGCLLFKRLN
jgi:hypothetical protein